MLPVYKRHLLLKHVNNALIDYPTPSNLNFFWNFGSLAGICLGIQLITGIALGMHYIPHIDYAFTSVDYIMREVNFGWIIRYSHANGASMFFIVVYVHIFRSLYYSSYLLHKKLVWEIGVIIFLLMILTAFTGYVLPWGQMSYWAATVITNFCSVLPLVGPKIVAWLWGGFAIGNPTLNRFYTFHYVLPFVILALVICHLLVLHEDGSNNPLASLKINHDKIPFHIYFSVKDYLGFLIMLFFFVLLIFFLPVSLGHPDNFIPADDLKTPLHIVPEWYFLPFYTILRSIPNKLLGIIAMISAILVLLVVPYLNNSYVANLEFRPFFKFFFWTFVANWILLGFIGSQPAEPPYVTVGQISTFFYFSYFLILLPLSSIFENQLNFNKI